MTYGRDSKGVIKLSPIQLDSLKEISTIGIGNAVTAFSELIGSKVEIKLSDLEMVPVDMVSGKLGHKNMLVTGIYIRIRGDVTGTSLLFFPRDSALMLADILNDREVGSSNVLKEIDRSALAEFGSILTASYLNAISDMLDLNVEMSVPSIVFDIASAIVYFVLLSSKEKIRYSLISQAKFVNPDFSITGEFLLLFDDKTIINLLNAAYERLKGIKDTASA